MFLLPFLSISSQNVCSLDIHLFKNMRSKVVLTPWGKHFSYIQMVKSTADPQNNVTNIPTLNIITKVPQRSKKRSWFAHYVGECEKIPFVIQFQVWGLGIRIIHSEVNHKLEWSQCQPKFCRQIHRRIYQHWKRWMGSQLAINSLNQI